MYFIVDYVYVQYNGTAAINGVVFFSVDAFATYHNLSSIQCT